MSNIFFHSVDGEASIRGSERAHFSIFCKDVTWAIVRRVANETTRERSILRNVFPPNHYALRSDDFQRDASLAFRVSDAPLILEGERVDLLHLTLCTAWNMGSDPVRLGARLDAQCEIHAYVEGPNRRWLAGIINHGLKLKFFQDPGWKSVIKLLEKDDTSPIVTSYSVCNTFPNTDIANYDPPFIDEEPDWDAWYKLSKQERWDMGIKGLRAFGGRLEMKPEDWDDYFFGDGMDANRLVAKLLELYPRA